MEIKDIKAKPFEKSIFPGIEFEVEVSYIKYQEAIISVNGILKTDDERIIGSLNESIENTEAKEVGARGTKFDSNFKEALFKTTIIATLDRRALNYIEERRMEDRKGDVNLILNLKVKSVNNRAEISYVHEINPKEIGLTSKEIHTASGKTADWQVLIYAYDSQFSSNRSNRWILSGSGSPIFLSINEQSLKKNIRIPSTDWIHDYAPKLELGEYFIVEIPKGKKIIEEAWQYIEKAEECFRRWDTKGAYANCREAGSLLDRTLKTKMGKDSFIYKERWGRTYERFNNFASLDLHLEDIKKSPGYSPDEVKINKTDAEHTLIVTKMLVKYAEELIEESK